MSKATLYAANTVPQVFVVGATVNFGTPVRRFGQNIKLSGGNVSIMGAGYYRVDANITLTTAAAGIVLVQIRKDGVPIPGAEASLTVADGTTYAVEVPAIVRNSCCREEQITVTIAGVAGTIDNAAVIVEKI